MIQNPEVVSTGNENQESGTTEFVPNYNYKVAQKELVFDERLQGIVKDKGSEEYVRDLVTRAEGLDIIKQRLTEKEQLATDLQSRFGEADTLSQKYKTGFDRLDQLSKSDLHSFQRAWKIPDEAVVKLARDILKANENPQIAQQHQQRFDSQVSQWQSEDNLQTQQVSVSQSNQELHEMKMELALSKPDVSSFVSQLDAMRGEGYFERKVQEYGTLQHYEGNYVAPKEAVQHVIDDHKDFLKDQQEVAQSNVPQPGQTQSPATSVVRDAPPIPNLGPGRTGSPVKQKPSWELLKKMGGMG